MYSIGVEYMLQRGVHIALFEWQKHHFCKTPLLLLLFRDHTLRLTFAYGNKNSNRIFKNIRAKGDLRDYLVQPSHFQMRKKGSRKSLKLTQGHTAN